MAEQIIDKQCIVCKQTKPLQDFRVRKDSKDGHRNDCCLCENARNLGRYHTPDGKKLAAKRLRKYHQSEKGRCCLERAKKKYYSTAKGILKSRRTSREYQRLHKEEIKAKIKLHYSFESVKRRNRQFRDKYPERYKAHIAVTTAIQNKTLQPANTHKCKYCNSQANHYHHHSYEPNKRLDVIPVCCDCHIHLHISQREAIVKIEVI